MSNNFIRINRKILQWGWYKDTNTFRVFIHLLLNANWHDGEYMGHKILRGQCVFGLKKISEDLGISVRNVRTALNHLKSTNEVTIKTTNKFSIATIVKYNDYQLQPSINDNQNDKQSDIQPTNNRQTTDNIQKGNKEINILNNIPPYNPPKEPTTVNQFIKSLDRSEKFKSAFMDFAEMRRTIKHPMTVRAAQMILNKLDKLSCNEQEQIDILNQSIEHSWQGVFALKDKQNKSIPDYSGSKDFFGR